MVPKYSPSEIEPKWQEKWAADRLYEVDEDQRRPKWYALTMFPYTSGDLHIGHWYAMAPSDVYARYKRMQGYNVLHPMGFDAFGLPAENAAIKRGIHPLTWTMQNIENMRAPAQDASGSCYDWSREVITCLPDYYKWTQWFFLKLYEAGLAYRAKAPVNWCPNCQTVLANEQVVGDGKCERCDTAVTRRGPGAVVLPHHQLRRRADGARRHGLAGAHQDHAAQLGGPERGRRDLLRPGPSRASTKRRSGSSPPGPIPSTASPSWCWRRSTRWWPS